ncbi:MAG: MotA/TolQ/ExbB proton channel family protein [Kofleriaceae bacterium]|nr:MotA/TolQ/ExbB proton channel family protein [Kofleriaceae bacterium]
MMTSIAAGSGAKMDIATLFGHAHWSVKAVMLTLVIMFFVGIYIIIFKTMYLRRAASETAQFNEAFWRSRDIEQIYKTAQQLKNSPISSMFVAGYTELAKLSSDDNLREDREGNLANIERALRKAQTTETTKLESMVPFLATTGSSAPFVGLLGTVVGIMLAFQEIAGKGSAGLDVVGPHIAEALFATAIGLVAAIPAVMAYNFFMRRIKVQRAEMEMFEQDYLNIIKRHFLR